MKKLIKRLFAGLMTLVLVMCSIVISPKAEVKALEKGDDGSYSRNFDGDGVTSDDFFTPDKGGKTPSSKSMSYTYNDTTYKKAIKLESATTITFTAPQDGKLLVVCKGKADGNGYYIKHSGSEEPKNVGSTTTGTEYETDIKKGEVTIGRYKGESYLFYIKYTPVAGESGHVCQFDKLIDSKEATCTEDGYKKYKCSVDGCEETYTDTVAAAHKYNEEWTVDTEATETTTGSMSRHCSVEGCNGVTDERIIPVLGSEIAPEGSYVYNFSKDDETNGYFTLTGDDLTSSQAKWGTLEFTKAFKFNSNGSIEFTAQTAGKVTLFFNWANAGNTIDVAQDGKGETFTIDTSGVISADVDEGKVTISREAKKESYCYYIRFTPVTEKHTHKYTSEVTKKPTCTDPGEITHTCSCNDFYTETIDPLGHDWDTEWTIDVPATEAAAGSKSHHCLNEGCDEKKDVTEIPQLEALTVNVSKTEDDETVTFKAEASGGSKGYTYKFIVYNQTTQTWGLIQNFSDSNTCVWTKGSVGDRDFYVDVKDSDGNVTRSELINIKIVDKVTLTGSATAIDNQTELTLTAGTTLGEGCTYKFLIYNPTTDQWFNLQDFSENNSYVWKAGNDGVRQFYVDVKAADGNVTRSKAFDVTIGTGVAEKFTASATADKNSVIVGDTVKFTVDTIGTSNEYTYKVVVYNKTTKAWGLVQNFSDNSVINWTAGSIGDRDFYVDVRNAKGDVIRTLAVNVVVTE